jgi:hypothetical protein
MKAYFYYLMLGTAILTNETVKAMDPPPSNPDTPGHISVRPFNPEVVSTKDLRATRNELMSSKPAEIIRILQNFDGTHPEINEKLLNYRNELNEIRSVMIRSRREPEFPEIISEGDLNTETAGEYSKKFHKSLQSLMGEIQEFIHRNNCQRERSEPLNNFLSFVWDTLSKIKDPSAKSAISEKVMEKDGLNHKFELIDWQYKLPNLEENSLPPGWRYDCSSLPPAFKFNTLILDGKYEGILEGKGEDSFGIYLQIDQIPYVDRKSKFTALVQSNNPTTYLSVFTKKKDSSAKEIKSEFHPGDNHWKKLSVNYDIESNLEFLKLYVWTNGAATVSVADLIFFVDTDK